MGLGTLQIVFAMPGMEPLIMRTTKLREDIADWTPFWTGWFQPFYQSERELEFETWGAHTGEPWPPLSLPYEAWKAKAYPGQGILVATGRLKNSLVGLTEDTIFEPAPRTLTVGTRVPYASPHQYGNDRLPRRPPLHFDVSFGNNVLRLLQEWVAGVWSGDAPRTRPEGGRGYSGTLTTKQSTAFAARRSAAMAQKASLHKFMKTHGGGKK